MKRVFEENNILHQLRRAQTPEEKAYWAEAERLSKVPRVWTDNDMKAAFKYGVDFGAEVDAQHSPKEFKQWLEDYRKK